jgi:hypothetical protein
MIEKSRSSLLNNTAKVQIKSEKTAPFGGIIHAKELFLQKSQTVLNES